MLEALCLPLGRALKGQQDWDRWGDAESSRGASFLSLEPLLFIHVVNVSLSSLYVWCIWGTAGTEVNKTAKKAAYRGFQREMLMFNCSF